MVDQAYQHEMLRRFHPIFFVLLKELRVMDVKMSLEASNEVTLKLGSLWTRNASTPLVTHETLCWLRREVTWVSGRGG